MGNPLDGDARQSAGKSNRTSSRKIYSVCCHFLIKINRKTVDISAPAMEFAVCRKFLLLWGKNS